MSLYLASVASSWASFAATSGEGWGGGGGEEEVDCGVEEESGVVAGLEGEEEGLEDGLASEEVAEEEGGCCWACSALGLALEKKERREEREEDAAERRRAGEASDRWKGEEIREEERYGDSSDRVDTRARAVHRTAFDRGRERDMGKNRRRSRTSEADE